MPISIVLLVALAVFIIAGFRIAQEYQRSVVFRLGRLRGVKGPGLYWIIPLVEWQRKLDIRTTAKDEAVRLTPPIQMTLEQAIAYIADDELVEVTPKSIRLRKRFLDPNERKRQARAAEAG